MMQALVRGFRLRVPATALWFNVEAEQWLRVRHALDERGAESAQGGMEGEELCAGPGLTVSYQADARRMQAELSAGGEGGADVVDCLAALRGSAPPPAAEASPVWLWSPEPFRIAGGHAQPAVRVLRGARWLLPRERAGEALRALGEALAELGPAARARCGVDERCDLWVSTPAAVSDADALTYRAKAFDTLLRRLGEPALAEYATHPE